MDIMTKTRTILTMMIRGDFDSYPDVHGFIDPDDCGVYCVFWGDAGVTPYWTGVEECDVYGGNVVLPRTGSDEPVNSVVRTTGPDEPVNGVTPGYTGVKECDVYEGDVALPWTSRPDYPGGPGGDDSTIMRVIRIRQSIMLLVQSTRK